MLAPALFCIAIDWIVSRCAENIDILSTAEHSVFSYFSRKFLQPSMQPPVVLNVLDTCILVMVKSAGSNDPYPAERSSE